MANEWNKLMITLPVNEKIITPEHLEANVGISKDYKSYPYCANTTSNRKA